MRDRFHVEPVRLAHQRAGADQQVAEPGACADTAVPVMGRIGRGEKLRMLPFARQKHPIPGHEDVVEDRDAGRLAVFGAEFRRGVVVPSGRARDDGDALRIHRHRATQREIRIRFGHVAARHDEILVHIGGGGDDGLGAADHHAVGAPLLDVHVGVGIRLLVRPQGPVALAVGHGDSERQVLVLDLVQVVQEPLVQLRALVLVDPVGRLIDRVQRIVGQIALRAADLAAHQADRLQLVDQVLRRPADVQHPVDVLAGGVLLGKHERAVILLQRIVVGHADGVDAGPEPRLVGDALDPVAVTEDARRIAPERLAVFPGCHEHGLTSPSTRRTAAPDCRGSPAPSPPPARARPGRARPSGWHWRRTWLRYPGPTPDCRRNPG